MRIVSILTFVLLTHFCGPLTAQDTQELLRRIEALEAKNDQLEEANQSLVTGMSNLKKAIFTTDNEGELTDSLKTDSLEKSIDDFFNRFDSYESGRLFFRESLTTGASEGVLESIRFGGEWRVRADARANASDLLSDVDDEGFRLDFRFNLGMGFTFDTGSDLEISTWLELQSAGRAANNTAANLETGLGGTTPTDISTRENTLDIVSLYQAYIEIRNLLPSSGGDLDLKLGRQELSLGSGLILGSNQFFTGTVHDALRADFSTLSGITVSIFYAKEASPDGLVSPGLSTGGFITGAARRSGDEDELAGIHATLPLLDDIETDFYYVYFNGRGPSDSSPINVTSPSDPAVDAFGRDILEGRIHTFGTWLRTLDFPIDGLSLSLEVVGQLGDDLDALALEFAADYRLPFLQDLNPVVYMGYYFAEGPEGDDNSRGFTPLFVSRHNDDPYHSGRGAFSRFGNLDLLPLQNVHIIQAGFRIDIDGWQTGATWLFAWQNHFSKRDPGTLLRANETFALTPFGPGALKGRAIGHEIDIYSRKKLGDNTSFFLNLSLFFPSNDFDIDLISGGTRIIDTDIAVGFYAQIQTRF